MLKRYALMESISSNLYDFLKKTGKNLSLPDKKFLRDGLVGLLRAGQPIVCQMARHLPDQRTKFISRLDRLADNARNSVGTFSHQREESPLPEPPTILWIKQ